MPPCRIAHPLPELKRTVLLHMFGSGVNAQRKEWLPGSWRGLAHRLIDAGHVVCFTGGARDSDRIATFMRCHLPASARDGGVARSLAGVLTLEEMASILPGVAAVVSVNTGFVHLAAMCGAPTIDLHGPTRPERWGAIGPRVVHLRSTDKDAGYLNLGFETTPYPISRMASIKVEDVVAGLRSLGVPV
jgi:ADP-heptose:LPS heptosyltransferase